MKKEITADERERRKLKASYEHTRLPAIQRVRDAMLPDLRPTWEAGRACGFHAGYDVGYAQALKDKEEGLV